MAAIGISFYYEKEKIDILKNAAKRDDRTTSKYIQMVLENHIKKEASKKKRTFKIKRSSNG